VKKHSFAGTVLLMALAIAIAYLQSRHLPRQQPPAPSNQTTEARPDAPRAPAPSFSASRGFRSRQQLEDHFDKHGREFGRITIDQYLKLAQDLRDAPVGGPIVERVRQSDEVITRFDRKSGAFIAFNSDGTIRTFFKPDDGEAYFNRQATRDEDSR
jgi:pyocin large subunit-like protein